MYFRCIYYLFCFVTFSCIVFTWHEHMLSFLSTFPSRLVSLLATKKPVGISLRWVCTVHMLSPTHLTSLACTRSWLHLWASVLVRLQSPLEDHQPVRFNVVKQCVKLCNLTGEITGREVQLRSLICASVEKIFLLVKQNSELQACTRVACFRFSWRWL
jgi:hypothetical protein